MRGAGVRLGRSVEGKLTGKAGHILAVPDLVQSVVDRVPDGGELIVVGNAEVPVGRETEDVGKTSHPVRIAPGVVDLVGERNIQLRPDHGVAKGGPLVQQPEVRLRSLLPATGDLLAPWPVDVRGKDVVLEGHGISLSVFLLFWLKYQSL